MSNKIKIPPHMEEWFRNMYPVTTDRALSQTLGCCTNTVWRLAQRRGLKKSPEHLERIAQRRRELANEANRKHPNKAFIEAGKKYRFKKGITNLERYGEELNEKRKKKVAQGYMAAYRKERARVSFGLSPKTNIRVSRQDPRKARFKWYLTSRGYIVDDEKRIVYYNSKTKRGDKVESRNQPWYTFKEQSCQQ